MTFLKTTTSKIGWNFDNSYLNLPSTLMIKSTPEKLIEPSIIKLNESLAADLNLNFDSIDKKKQSLIFSGNLLPHGSECISQAYAGHQFGFFTMLGDGRALLLGEHINKKKQRFDIQLKGSGITPFSRNGDGKATLKSMLREYLISEAMHFLNVPTTRSLAVTKTGEKVLRDDFFEGGILTRVASSHIRVGTFQYLATKNDINSLKKLVKYTLERHFIEKTDDNAAINLLNNLMEKQISLIVNWMRVGFIHGVMNTDNMTLSGETIDYGPCAFMDHYNPNTVFSSIDKQKRYSFVNQEIICHWNLSRFAETLIPLIDTNEDNAIKIGSEIINSFKEKFNLKWTSMIKSKLGILGSLAEDNNLILKIFDWMEKNNADYTNTFLKFMDKEKINDDVYDNLTFKNLYLEWNNRIKKNKIPKEISEKTMKSNNPKLIPRNHLVEDALNDAENNNFIKFNKLIELIKTPYSIDIQKNKHYCSPPDLNFTKNYRTFCGT